MGLLATRRAGQILAGSSETAKYSRVSDPADSLAVIVCRWDLGP